MPHSNDDYESATLLGGGDTDNLKGFSRNETSQKSNKTPIIISVALLLFFLFDIAAFLTLVRQVLTATSPGDADTMEFRNPYIGLAELYKAHPDIKRLPYNRIVNEPKLATQVSPVQPHKIFPVDPHQWLSDFGRLSPPDSRLQVSPEIDTIVQFNVLDWGMEKCAIAVRLPGRGEVLPHPHTLPESGDTVALDICEIDIKRPFKESSLTWANRPLCRRGAGSIRAKIGGEVELEPFFCKSGSYLAYQVSCAAPTAGCNVDVWTNQNQTWGVFLHQYQTV